LTFAWRDGTPILDLVDGFDNNVSAADLDYHPSDTDSSSDDFSTNDSSDDFSTNDSSDDGF
jgi:hypothetical protein